MTKVTRTDLTRDEFLSKSKSRQIRTGRRPTPIPFVGKNFPKEEERYGDSRAIGLVVSFFEIEKKKKGNVKYHANSSAEETRKEEKEWRGNGRKEIKTGGNR